MSNYNYSGNEQRKEELEREGEGREGTLEARMARRRTKMLTKSRKRLTECQM